MAAGGIGALRLEARREGLRTRVVRAAAAIRRVPGGQTTLFALLAAAVSATAFARVAEDYLTNDPLARWDVSFARWLEGGRSGALVDVFRAVTVVGSPAFVLALATVVCVLLFRRRRLADAALLPLVLGGAELLNLVLKLAFHRTRPEVAFVHLDTYSFPSGHAMISAAAYGAFAFLLWSRARAAGRRALLALGTIVLVALICFSRLYLGVHYLSDVLAGVAGGATWLALSLAAHAAYGDRFTARFGGSRLDRLARRLTVS